METEMTYGSDYYLLPVTSIRSKEGLEAAPDIYCYTIQIVNVAMVGDPVQDNWFLVDAGMPYAAEHIISASEERFGSSSRPQCIVLTHGHFDHVGAIVDLVKHWNVPVYAHPLELPYLTGKERYPLPDSSVEGGLVAKMSPFFPIEPVNLGHHVQSIPSNGTIPGMLEWQWIHTPGHTPGHISIFREKDRSLIAGAAFVTVKQDALYRNHREDTTSSDIGAKWVVNQ